MNPVDFCILYNIIDYTINEDQSIDVDGDVWLSNLDIQELPVVFNVVTGSFYISDNGLTTLKGSPKWVEGSFSCFNNRLTTLRYSPIYIGTHFNCRNNNLRSIFGGPRSVGGNFYCDNTMSEDMLIVMDGFMIPDYEKHIKMVNRSRIIRDMNKK